MPEQGVKLDPEGDREPREVSKQGNDLFALSRVSRVP